MLGETGFTVLVYSIWISATAFGSLVCYWFLRQGFAEEGIADGEQFPLESRSYTRTSLLLWVGFAIVLTLLIVFAA